MQKVTKRLFSAAICLAMVLSMIMPGMQIQANAAEDPVIQKVESSEFQDVTVSSIHGSTPVGQLTDGNYDNYVDSNYNDPAQTMPNEYTFQLASPIKLSSVKVYPRKDGTNGRPVKCVVEVSSDGSSYAEAGKNESIDPNSAEPTEISTTTEENVSFVKIRVWASEDNFTATHVVTVAEIEMYEEIVTGGGQNPDEPKDPAELTKREQIEALVEQVNDLYEQGKYTFMVDQSVNQALADAEKKLNNPEATEDNLDWSIKYLNNALAAMNDTKNHLSEIEKKIYWMIVEADAADTSLYTEESWAAYAAECQSARGKLNGNYDDTEMQKCLDAMEKAQAGLVEVDDNLQQLKKLAEEYGEIENEDYTRESWRAFKGALYDIEALLRENKTELSDEEFNQYKTAVISAKDALIAGTAGQEFGIHSADDPEKDVWKSKNTDRNIKGGQLYVSNEVINDDGTTTLTITWINDGKDPETGRAMKLSTNGKVEWKDRAFSESDWKKVKKLRIYYIPVGSDDPLHDTEYVRYEELTADDRNRFTKEITLPEAGGEPIAGTRVFLELSGNNGEPRTYSLGAYLTRTQAVDKTELQKLYDESSALELVYAPATETDSLYKVFISARTSAKEILDDAGATQEEVDKAYALLENRYWLEKVNDMSYHYSRNQSNFDCNEYTTESVIPLMKVWMDCRNHINRNYTGQEATKNLKQWYQDFLDAEKQLVEVPENFVGFVGINDDNNMTSNGNDHQSGKFIVTEEACLDENNQAKIKLHITYINDGLHPITGDPKEDWSIAELNNGKLRCRYKTYEGSNVTKFITSSIINRSKEGFEAEIIVEPGMYSFEFYYPTKRAETGTVGTYYTSANVYSIKFDAQNGTAITETVKLSGEALGTLPEVTREGYKFLGWFTEAAGGTEVTAETVANASATYYAHWEEPVTDTTAPEADVQITVSQDKKSATATIKANEPLKDLAGWTRVDDRTFTKTFTGNGTYLYTIEDLAGNKRTVTVKIELPDTSKTSGSNSSSSSGSSGSSSSKGSSASAQKLTSVRTGDTAAPGIYLAVIAAAAVVMGFIGVKRKKDTDK